MAVVRLRVGLGDLLATVPALRALKRSRPDIRITMVTWQEVAGIVERLSPYVDDLLCFPGYPGIPDRPPWPEALPAFIAEATARRFDLALQMYGGHTAANRVTELLAARITGGFFTPGEWRADRSTHIPYPTRAHEIHRHLILMSRLGLPWGDDRLEFTIGELDLRAAGFLMTTHGLYPGGFVCLHPGSTAPTRRWPPERFAAVADELSAAGLRVVLIGSDNERRLTHAVAVRANFEPVDLAGETSLGCLAALLKQSLLLVCNDSGPSHLAAAVGTPTVTVFLAGELERWRGLDRSLHTALRAGVECQPCPHQRCPIDFRCAGRLSPDVVTAAAFRSIGWRARWERMLSG